MADMVGDGKRSWRRFQAILWVSVLVPCVLLGYLAVHVLRTREAQMTEMARSRALATAQMAVSAAEKALQGSVDKFLMGAMKLELGPPASTKEALAGYLAEHPAAVAAFVFDGEGHVLGRAAADPRRSSAPVPHGSRAYTPKSNAGARRQEGFFPSGRGTSTYWLSTPLCVRRRRRQGSFWRRLWIWVG